MDFRLSEEHIMLRKMIRDFAENELGPTVAERDEQDIFDINLWKKMADYNQRSVITRAN